MKEALETPMYSLLTKKYLRIYKQVRECNYPFEHSFLITKIKFQEYIIKLMLQKPEQTDSIIHCYQKLRGDASLPEKAIQYYDTNRNK
jgi:hypothetical protein